LGVRGADWCFLGIDQLEYWKAAVCTGTNSECVCETKKGGLSEAWKK